MAIDTIARALACSAKQAVMDMSSFSVKKVNSVEEVKQTNILYLVPKADVKDKDVFDEYIFIDGKAEHVGNTNLSGYSTTEEVQQLINNALTSIVNGNEVAY